MSAATGNLFQAPVPSRPESDSATDELTAEERIKATVLEIYSSKGWTRVDKNGNTVPDEVAARDFVYRHFRDHVVVNSDSDTADDGLTPADLYAKTFPGALGATSQPVDDDEQFQAYQTVMRKLWQWTSPRFNGYCQETAEMEGLDLVMCEKKVYRATRDASTGTGAPKQVHVRFFTSSADMIFAYSAQPATAKLVKAAEDTARHLRMNTSRHPELTKRVAREADLALNRSAAHLAPVTGGRTKRALAAGDAGDND